MSLLGDWLGAKRMKDPVRGTAQVVSAPQGVGKLEHSVEGVHNGSYSQLLVGKGFVGGVENVATGKGVTDELSGDPGAGALTFA